MASSYSIHPRQGSRQRKHTRNKYKKSMQTSRSPVCEVCGETLSPQVFSSSSTSGFGRKLLFQSNLHVPEEREKGRSCRDSDPIPARDERTHRACNSHRCGRSSPTMHPQFLDFSNDAKISKGLKALRVASRLVSSCGFLVWLEARRQSNPIS